MGCIVRVVPDRQTKSRKTPTRKMLPPFFVLRCWGQALEKRASAVLRDYDPQYNNDVSKAICNVYTVWLRDEDLSNGNDYGVCTPGYTRLRLLRPAKKQNCFPTFLLSTPAFRARRPLVPRLRFPWCQP